MPRVPGQATLRTNDEAGDEAVSEAAEDMGFSWVNGCGGQKSVVLKTRGNFCGQEKKYPWKILIARSF
jgi:hypothetical protein